MIETSPFPSETAHFADILVPDTTYLERWQDAPTYPNKGWPQTGIRVPAIAPIHDCKTFGDTLIEIGKCIEGPMGRYYEQVGDVQNILRHLAKGFEDNPGDNGVNSFETWIVAYASQVNAPIRTGVEVLEVRRNPGRRGFTVITSRGAIETNSIVAATGPFQKPIMDRAARDLA